MVAHKFIKFIYSRSLILFFLDIFIIILHFCHRYIIRKYLFIVHFCHLYFLCVQNYLHRINKILFKYIFYQPYWPIRETMILKISIYSSCYSFVEKSKLFIRVVWGCVFMKGLSDKVRAFYKTVADSLQLSKFQHSITGMQIA